MYVMKTLTHVTRTLRQSAVAPPPSRTSPLVSLPPSATGAHHHRSPVSPTYLVTLFYEHVVVSVPVQP
ncbi:hypothetical protein Hanom_Chr12g01108411 [Helianthus anomalus]